MPSIPAPGIRPLGLALVDWSIRRRRWVFWAAAILTVALGAQIVRVETDTDPENMLPAGDEVRLRNEALTERFGSTNSVFIGLLREDAPVARPDFLAAASALIDELRATEGVLAEGIVSYELALGDDGIPATPAEAAAVAERVAGNELLAGFAITEEGDGLGVFVPLAAKSDAQRAAGAARSFIEADPVLAPADTQIAGLPLAEEKFGDEMFLQMALFAPLAGLLVFALMLYFFRKLTLVLAAMTVALLSVTWTMGLLIGLGFSVHIMASMIPIFLMPIAILDSIHILSEFLDRYAVVRDRRRTLRAVYAEIMVPVSYTTLTTAVAFGSLTIAPIPPVQVFGAFVAVGVLLAWVLTMVFLPAFVMALSEESLERLVRLHGEASSRWFSDGVRGLGRMATRRPRLAPAGFTVLALTAIPGILLITVNDNPVRWFKSGSEIRQDTEALNTEFGGVYQANLVLTADGDSALMEPATVAWVEGLEEAWSAHPQVGAVATYAALLRRDGAAATTAAGNRAWVDDATAGPAASLAATLIDADAGVANLQLRMTSGDNTAMQSVIDATDAYVAGHPLPAGVTTDWAGETYLNLVWQDKMVSGMLNAFLTTLATAFVLMIVLFRSLRWAVVALVPMAAAIVLVYGVAGYVAKDYDMPMAVLSTLVLGIGIDFAIHFIVRYRELRAEHGTAADALAAFFEEPARALTRNAVIIALGFVPLLFASLVPYIIVGALLVGIMSLSWLATVLVLPGIARAFDSWLPVARPSEPAPPVGGQQPVSPGVSGGR
jgi:predicted RND superfamily exporter protein